MIFTAFNLRPLRIIFIHSNTRATGDKQDNPQRLFLRLGAGLIMM